MRRRSLALAPGAVRRPALIHAPPRPAALAARRVTSTIPIVFATGTDPVGDPEDPRFDLDRCALEALLITFNLQQADQVTE